MQVSPELIARALAGDRDTLRLLVDLLTPVIQARVARGLLRRATAAKGRSVRQEVEDLTQEVFIALFEDGGKTLRAWDPGRGLSLESFVGFVAERQVASLLRTARRSPWTEDPTLTEELDLPAEGADLELRLSSQQTLELLWERLCEQLSPLGRSLFEQLLVRQRPVAEVCAELGMSREAVYAWQSRLGRLCRKLGAEIMSDSPPVSRMAWKDGTG